MKNIFTILLQVDLPISNEATNVMLETSPYNPVAYGVLVLVLFVVAWLGVKEVISSKKRIEQKYDLLMVEYLKVTQESIVMLTKVEDKIRTFETATRTIDELKESSNRLSDRLKVVDEIKSELGGVKALLNEIRIKGEMTKSMEKNN